MKYHWWLVAGVVAVCHTLVASSCGSGTCQLASTMLLVAAPMLHCPSQIRSVCSGRLQGACDGTVAAVACFASSGGSGS